MNNNNRRFKVFKPFFSRFILIVPFTHIFIKWMILKRFIWQSVIHIKRSAAHIDFGRISNKFKYKVLKTTFFRLGFQQHIYTHSWSNPIMMNQLLMLFFLRSFSQFREKQLERYLLINDSKRTVNTIDNVFFWQMECLKQSTDDSCKCTCPHRV